MGTIHQFEETGGIPRLWVEYPEEAWRAWEADPAIQAELARIRAVLPLGYALNASMYYWSPHEDTTLLRITGRQL